ncbi:alpha/beta-hydrolase [Lentithecium fluviatile CBS 122367]|uniref:Alpha/beta-hydrolase n=1 Tax=Lentithecium fluviatile CBS 122367 TaxID=1168545 RepID=A0A6G1IF20_9PLEO|nr:alpha/beta-hydrolase [Lentithecium fluviatile CBS 122367]
MSETKPFNPEIPKEVDRLFRKLGEMRLPKEPIVPDAGWNYGENRTATASAVSEWHHFTTDIENLRVHFIHEKAKKREKEAIPLLLMHGWPGTFIEFQNAMKPLLDPDDKKAPVFNLVDTAHIYDVLMKRLGYSAYVALAGDWGHWVVRELESGRYDACKAVHTSMCPGAPPTDYMMNAKEQAAIDRAGWWMGTRLNEGHMLYAISMHTRHQTVGVAFNDNPVGIMMFIGEKYEELADPNLKTATLEDMHFLNDMCTTLSLYFFTPPSIMTSMLCYYNNVRHEVYTEFNAKEENLIRVLVGVSMFPYNVFPLPKKGAETTTTNLKFFRGA